MEQSNAQSGTSQAQEKAQQVAGQAQEKAQEAAGQAKSQLRSQVDQRSTQAGERVRSTASDMRSVAEQLREQGKDQPAQLAEKAADRAERVGGYLRQADADRILGDLEDFGRRQPLAVMLGGLALGFAASRFLKASSQNRYQAGPASGVYRPPAPREIRELPPLGTTSSPDTSFGTPSTPGTPPTARPVPPLPHGTPDAGTGAFDRPSVPTPGAR